jgi:RND family efflux transporter MFP subunit
MRFEFTFDEASYLRYERIAAGGNDAKSRSKGMRVSLRLIDEGDFKHQATVDFVDNVIDRATGTIRGRAVVPNPNGMFTPGMFARVRVPGSVPYEALLVPDVAIGSEQVRKFVFVVGSDNKVQPKYVTLGQLAGNGMRVIKDGLSADDTIVVNGLARIRPGIAVNPQQQGATPPPAAGGPQANNK